MGTLILRRADIPMGWLRLVGCLKIQVFLQNTGLFCRALLQKRPIFLSILLIVATPYLSPHAQGAKMPLHYAVQNHAGPEVVAALLLAYPDAASWADEVRYLWMSACRCNYIFCISTSIMRTDICINPYTSVYICIHENIHTRYAYTHTYTYTCMRL